MLLFIFLYSLMGIVYLWDHSDTKRFKNINFLTRWIVYLVLVLLWLPIAIIKEIRRRLR